MKKMTSMEKHLLRSLVLEMLKKNVSGGFIKSTEIVWFIPQLKNGSNLRKIINILRQEGEPIISNHYGYKYTEDILDLFTYSHSLRLRIEEMSKAYKGLVKYIQENAPDMYDFK